MRVGEIFFDKVFNFLFSNRLILINAFFFDLDNGIQLYFFFKFS